ncbi:hypothetical protein EV368DRAFT_80347 [Lentinula lateritia]|nr:hypothetical protein EV368DRAFT_80347 [Lentinula lateritia]
MFSTSEFLIVQLIESQDGTPSSVIQDTVQSLINQVTSPETASSILKGFTSNNDGQSLLFQKVLQTDVNDKASLKILSLIMKYAAHEGKGVRICDIRRACIIKDDQALFEFVRDTKLYRKSAGSAPDAIYLGSTGLQDIVVVKPRITNPLRVSSSNRHQPAFTANLLIPMFQIRMRGLNEVKLEFIAQGRMWCLTFRKKNSLSLWRRTRRNTESAADNWQIGLSLTDRSESTPVQATITFLPSTRSSAATAARGGLQLKDKHGLRIGLITKPGERLVSEPDSAQILSRLKVVKGQTQEIYASLDSGILGSSGSTYIQEDGSMFVILEAILAMTVKPSKPKLVKNVQKTDEPIVDDDVPSVCL